MNQPHHTPQQPSIYGLLREDDDYVLGLLAVGIDPDSCLPLPSDSPCHRSDIQEVLSRAEEAFRFAALNAPRRPVPGTRPPRWWGEEEEAAVARMFYLEKRPLEQIAAITWRTVDAIRTRLYKLVPPLPQEEVAA